jgi:hypothetical protein
MSGHAFTTLVVAAVTVASAVLALPIVVALVRDIDGKSDVLLLSVLLGWTGVAWACALILALTRPRRQAVATSHALEPARRHAPLCRRAYQEGVYLVSAGADSQTWAVHSAGEWRIVYEVAGVERLVAAVAEADVPLSVLADALRVTR